MGLVLAHLLICSVVGSGAETLDYSKEAFVIQSMATKVSFSATGARDWQQTVSIRIQSEAAVREFGVLVVSYSAENEQAKVEYVRVKKPDGSVVPTPETSVLDVATQVAAAAPTYSDLRQKQIPVKALGVGDVLEYSFHSTQKAPEIPGEFWYDQYFTEDAVVLNQSLEVRYPKDKYVQVASPKLKPETKEEGDQRIYAWTHSHLKLSQPAVKKPGTVVTEPLKVQLTTFRNWAAVGKWWSGLATPQAAVTPAIQEKAKELTATLSSNADKAKAIYEYVGLKFRYISISLGAGRYRPHSAAEVFANQYGDCKDKHTLFVSLLKAAGIQAWPALIGAGIKLDEGVPSPAQFNHVITVLPEGGNYLWADTTAEVAPFGLLSLILRDEQALVIPENGNAILVKTPMNPPFPSLEAVSVKSSLTGEGLLTGRFEYQMVGDGALAMRSALRQLAPAQWQVLAQQMSYALGYGGDVSGVEVENLESVDKPLHYSYDYSRKNYSDWAEHKITPPVPPIGFGPGDEAEKPKEPFWTGAPGTLNYRASVQLPKGYSLEPPSDTKLNSEFAEYTAHYSLVEGSLVAERKLLIKQAKITVEQWAEYQKFSKGLSTDQTRFILLAQSGGVQSATGNSDSNSEAEQLLERASRAVQARNVNEAQDLLAQVERLNPKEAKLWAIRSYLALTAGDIEQAIADGRKEVQFHPDEIPAYQQLTAILMTSGRRDEAIDVWRGALAVKPEDEGVAMHLTGLLLQEKRYKEILSVLEKPIAAAPDKYVLQVQRVHALLGMDQKDEGIAEAKKIAKATSDPVILNDVAYVLSDTGSALGMAQEWAQKAVDQTEQNTAKASLDSFDNQALVDVNALGMEWDTLGWIYFRQGDFVRAEEYIRAAWELGQHAAVADHLGQLYEKQGKHAAAIHSWRLALASNKGNQEAQEHLRKAGEPVFEPRPLPRNAVGVAEELGTLRTVKVPALTKQTGSAEFFVLLSREGFEDVRFISGLDALKNAAPGIKATSYRFSFPDSGAEKLIRRGILSCSTYTNPSCQFTMLLPSTATAAPVSVNAPKTE